MAAGRLPGERIAAPPQAGHTIDLWSEVFRQPAQPVGDLSQGIVPRQVKQTAPEQYRDR
jgi:hypothetical protein